MYNELFIINNIKVPIVINNKTLIKSVIIRFKKNPKIHIYVTKPFYVSKNKVKTLIEQNRINLEKHILQSQNLKEKLKDGSIIEFLDKKVLIKHNSNIFNNYYENNNVLVIGGNIDKLEFRVREIIKAEFLAKTKEIVKSLDTEYKPSKITIKDTSSQWGSCNTKGNISLSWRLAFAPIYILKYVICHEMAHLKYMNHSTQFWNFVNELYECDCVNAKNWLKQNGYLLYKYF